MNNLDVVTFTIEKHRIARQWDNAAVAQDILTQLGVDPDGEAEHSTIPNDGVSDDEVKQLEFEAHVATQKAMRAREAHEAANPPARTEPEPETQPDTNTQAHEDGGAETHGDPLGVGGPAQNVQNLPPIVDTQT